MSLLSSVKFSILLLPLCQCFFIEISITDKNDSKSVKLVCGPPTENLNLRSNHTVLWHGSEFGSDEQQQLLETLQTDVLVPNITINSSKRHECYLLASQDAYKSFFPQKKRVSREDLQASIPMENGVCPPGHRIDQDRCYPCFPGSYTSGQNSVCYLCPKDFYMDMKAADSCWPCPSGKKTLAQGADSEDACVYFYELGHPAVTQTPPWIPIFILIGFIIIICWIVIIILVLRYWKSTDPDQSETTGSEAGIQITISMPMSESDDHIYSEIDEYADENMYEVPKKPSEELIYVEVVPDVPEKKPWKKSAEKRQSSEHMYEEPISKKSDGPKADSEHMYEEPISKKSVGPKADSEHIYEELNFHAISENHLNEIPKRSSTSDNRTFGESRNRNYLKYSKQKREEPDESNDFYEVPISKRSASYSNKIPTRRSFTSDGSASKGRTGNSAISYEVADISDEVLRRTRSKGFNPDYSSTRTVRKMSSETRRQSDWNAR